MGLLTKALKTAVKAADAAKDASRTKPKSQMNPLVKARKKPAETDFDKSASQEVKDFLSAVEEKDPNQLGEFYSPVINTLEEMPIGKQGTKGENISAFLNKRAPNVESSERASFGLKLDPQRRYTRKEVIDIAKGDGSEEYTISKVNPSGDPTYNEYRGMQRQNVKDKEEEYFVLTVDSTKNLDAAGTNVHFGKPETNLGHTRSSIRIETPEGGPLTKKIKDRERYILVEELQSDIATDYGKLKKTDKEGKPPVNPNIESIDNIVDQNIENALEELEFNMDSGLTITNSKIINAIKQAHINMHKNNIDRFEAGEDLAKLLKEEYNINFKGRPEIYAVSKRAIFNSLETEDGIQYGGNSVDVDDTIFSMFDDIKTEVGISKAEQKKYEQQQTGLPINPPIETRSDYVKKLILANINYAKRNNINKIVVPDYKEIARQRINTFDYAMDQADDSNPTAIKNAELYNDLEDGKITQQEYDENYNKLAKEYFESIFQKTYQDALKKVLNNLKTETKGAIKIGTRKLEYPAAGNFKGRTSTATEIDITDFDFDPETQALRFNMGGAVPPKNYAEGGVVSMNNQTQQAFALGGLKDEGGEIDEASGNRVPIGGTKEGVRDDIPANVSEGEFIFPADVVRYHGLDKMMALRQEAKMGLKQMESMGQMGNSEEASMPDDLPFEMADLIVVGGQGEPMEFANGGFVPQMQTLQTAPVPTMGGGTSTGTQTPIVYDDFMKTPVVTMQEYRDANGNSIIITSVNGKATTEIPSGYTLYVPPTNAAPTATQAVIQTANNYSYQTSGGGDEGSDTPRELQVDPDYASMDNDTYFSTMERQNSFGSKAGNAAAMGIALAMGPIGLLTMGMLQADKKRQLTSAEQRIAAETNPTKKKAYQATFAKMGGKTKEPEEENALVKFGKGFVAAVGGLFGFGNDEVETVASVAGSAAADNTNVVSAAPERSLLPQLRPAGLGASAKSIAPTESTMDIMGGVGTEFTPVPPTGTSTVVTQPPSMQSNDAKVTTTPAIKTTAKPARPKPGESIPEVTQQTQRPLTMPSGGVDDTAAIQAGMEPVVTEADISDTLQRLPAGNIDRFIKTTFSNDDSRNLDNVDAARLVVNQPRVPAPAIERPVTQTDAALGAQTDMQMGIDPKNIYPTREQEKLDADVYNTNAQYRQIIGGGGDPKYVAEKASRLRTPSQLLDNQEFEIPSLLGAKYPISNFAAFDAAERGTFQPDYTTGQQTDAALGAQTDYGQRIANARGDSFTSQPNVQVAGLGDYVPDSIKNAFTSRVAPSLDKGQARANEILQRQAMEFGPQLPTIPRADPVDDPLGANAQAAAAVTETGISREPRDVKFVPQVDNRQVVADELREESLTMPSQVRQEPPTVLPDPAIQQTTVPRNLPVLNMPVQTGQVYNPTDSLGTDPMPDPRQAFADNRVYSSPREEADKRGLSDSQLTLGRARNVSTMPDPYVASLNSAFGRSSVEDQTANVFSTATGTVGGYDEVGTIIDNIDVRAPELSTTSTGTAVLDDELPSAARTSKGTSTRKAAPTGDDRLSQANFLERALGITPAPISARRGNDGVLYRTQADKREADNRQEQAKATQRGSDRYKARNEGYQGLKGDAAVEKFNKDNAADIGKRHGGDKEDGSDRVICTELYKQGKLDRELYRMDVVYTAKHLSPITVRGYHYWAVPMVVKMRSSTLLTNVFEYLTIARAKEIAHIVKPKEYKDRSVLGYLIKNIGEAICYSIGLFTDQKDWTVLYNKGAVK